MRLRFQSVSYQSGSAASGRESQHPDLRSAMFQLGQQYPYLQPGGVWRPAMDIHETPDMVLVKIELAGVAEESLEITLYRNAVIVTGQRLDDSADDEERYFHEAQIRYGPFRADAYLSTPIQAELASAVYHNGFLRISLPRRAAASESPDEPQRENDTDDTPEGDEPVDTHETSDQSSPLQPVPSGTHEPARSRLTYVFAEETSHA